MGFYNKTGRWMVYHNPYYFTDDWSLGNGTLYDYYWQDGSLTIPGIIGAWLEPTTRFIFKNPNNLLINNLLLSFLGILVLGCLLTACTICQRSRARW